MKNKGIKLTGLIILLIAVDQLIKLLVVKTLGVSLESITIIPKILKLTYFENAESAFGIFSGRIILIGLDIMIIFFIAKMLLNKKMEVEDKSKLALSLILAGGMGNLLDRIFRGYVVDYMDMSELFGLPIFNFSDICIIAGAILLIVLILINTIKNQENREDATV